MKKSTIIFIIIFLAQQLYAAFPNSFSDIVKQEKIKVVHVLNTSVVKARVPTFFKDFFEDRQQQQERRQTASGSGFFISKDGYIVTNNHVIDGAESLEVVLSDETSYEAKVIGTDPRTDLALIKIDIKNAPFVKFGNSNKLEIGDWVVAIGNPLGLDFTVTAGILSAKERDIFGGTAYGAFLQTDAAINRGNSGGPLYNTKGEVIGINTAIIAGGQGLGFAIPSNLAVKIVEELKQNGEVRRGWLGVGIQNVTPDLSISFQLPKGTKGVAITGIQEDSPAAKAQLKRGDVIISYNGKPIRKTSQLQQNVAESKIGSKNKIVVYRNGKKVTKTVQVSLAPKDLSTFKVNPEFSSFDMILTPVTRDIRESLGLTEKHGLLIQQIKPDGIASKNDLKVGDIILEVNTTKVRSIADFNSSIKKSVNKKALLLLFRDGNTIFRSLPVNF